MDHTSAADVDAEASFRRLFTSTYQDLLAYARRRSFDHAEADDIVAEAYAVAWRRRADRNQEAPPLPWLYGIAANVLRNSRRAGDRRLQLVERLQAQPDAADGAGIAGPVDAPGVEIRDALGRLSFDDQEILRLVAWEGLSHAEAAEALGCSVNAVGIRIHRARQRLRVELDGPSPETAASPDNTPFRPSTEASSRRGGATS